MSRDSCFVDLNTPEGCRAYGAATAALDAVLWLSAMGEADWEIEARLIEEERRG